MLQAQPITRNGHYYGSFAKYKPDSAVPNDTIFKFMVSKESRIILPRLGSWETYVSRYSPDHEEKRALWLCKRGDTLEILEKGLQDHMNGVLTIKVGGVYYSVPYGGATLNDSYGGAALNDYWPENPQLTSWPLSVDSMYSGDVDIYGNATSSLYTDTTTYNNPFYITPISGFLHIYSGSALMNNVVKPDRHYTLLYTTDRMADSGYWYIPPVKKSKKKHETNIIRHFP